METIRVKVAACAAALAISSCARSGGAAPGDYKGTITFARGDATGPVSVVDLDLATGKIVARLDGWDASTSPKGDTAYIARVKPGHFGDAAVTIADARGVPSAPLYPCKDFNYGANRICHTPKVSPDGQRVAFGTVGDGGKVCKNSYDMFWGDYVLVFDRAGKEVARFEGYLMPEWLPDGRLPMLGSDCRKAGVWISDKLGEPRRVDGGQVATPASAPAVSADGKRVAFAWNNQLWTLTLDGKPELTKVSSFEKPVTAAAWSPDGKAFAVLLHDINLPDKRLILFRPGDEKSQVTKTFDDRLFGPLTWR